MNLDWSNRFGQEQRVREMNKGVERFRIDNGLIGSRRWGKVEQLAKCPERAYMSMF